MSICGCSDNLCANLNVQQMKIIAFYMIGARLIDTNLLQSVTCMSVTCMGKKSCWWHIIQKYKAYFDLNEKGKLRNILISA
jgi:hypothetical protein